MAPSAASLVFKVRRCEPELVAPAKTTPHEIKQLSDVDDREREQVSAIMLYRNDQSQKGSDPVKVIREALALLVYIILLIYIVGLVYIIGLL